MRKSGWTVAELGSLVAFRSGGTPSKQDPDNWGSHMPWVSARDLKRQYLTDSELHLSEQGVSRAKITPRHSILVLVRGMTLLKDVPICVTTREVAFNQDIKALVPKDGIDPVYLSYALISKKNEIQNYVDTAGHGTGRLETERLMSVPILLPPRGEQEKIARILMTWDRGIETMQALVENSEVRRRALSHRLVSGRLRLRGYENEWQEKHLSELANRVTRRNDGGGHPVLTISSSVGFIEQKDKYRRFMAGKSLENYILLKRGEFAYNKGNSKTYQFGCVFPLEDFSIALVPHVYVCFRLNADLHPGFYRHLFAADYLRPQLGRLVNTGVRNNGLLNITPKQFFATTVPVPPREEQLAIAKVLDALESQNSVLRRRLDGFREEKHALMQQLLTGKCRVNIENSSGLLSAIPQR